MALRVAARATGRWHLLSRRSAAPVSAAFLGHGGTLVPTVGPTRGARWSVEKEKHHVLPNPSDIVREGEIHAALAATAEAARDPDRVRAILQTARERALLTKSGEARPTGGACGVAGEEDLGEELKSEYVQGLSLEEAATLLNVDSDNEELMKELFSTALFIKELIYGNRIVIFAPLYLSNYCVNGCTYCAYRGANKHIARDKLSTEDLVQEVKALQRQGHRRLLLLTGEHPEYTFDEFLDALKLVAKTESEPYGRIRRINVEIPALSVSDLRRLKETDVVGTYTLFQETYHRESFEKFHPRGTGPKSDYDGRLTVMDRAQIAGIDDVGIGALFGLYDYRFEVLAMLQHGEHLEKTYGAGPHTISVPRIRPADHAPDAVQPPMPVGDDDFRKLVAVIRCAVPYTGMILSTRESVEMRRDLLNLGVSQMSAGSKTDVHAYTKGELEAEGVMNAKSQDGQAVFERTAADDTGAQEPVAACSANSAMARLQAEVAAEDDDSAPPIGDKGSETKEHAGQFELLDHRGLDEVVGDLMADGFVPSFCTACYRNHRTGEAFMKIAKAGDIKNFCHPNSLITLQEFLDDYASPEVKKLGEQVVERETDTISRPGVLRGLEKKMRKIKLGERDLYF